jgi:murein DD-endopeptidase MepM/ murein hydrolase activator NlpD
MVGFLVRNRSKISRYFRRLFEAKSVKRVVGTNLALMLVLGSFVPVQSEQIQPESTVIPEPEITISTVTERTIQYPLRVGYISQGYSLFHPALDIAAPRGTDIKPIKDGVIENVSRSRVGYGNAVIVDHGNGIKSLYAHLSKINISKGDKVTVLDTIGNVGATGHSTGPHLHLEVRKNGIPINPFAILPTLASSRF